MIDQTRVEGGVNLQTDTTVTGGYSNYLPIIRIPKNPSFPTLDRSAGYQLDFELQIHSEIQNNNDRAGFSVIAISDDSMGIAQGPRPTW